MKKLFIRLASLGMKKEMRPYLAKRLTVFNYCNIFGFFASLVRFIYMMCISPVHYTDFTVLINVLPLLISAIMMASTYFQLYKAATYISFICMPPILFLMYAATLDSSVRNFIFLYFIFPFFFLHRPKYILLAFSIAVLCFVSINFGDHLNLLFYSSNYYPVDTGLTYIDYFFSISFIFIALYAIKFLVWSYEKSLRKRKQELKELNFFKDRMFSIISHDLRSPIAATSQFLDLLKNVKIDQKEFDFYLTGLQDCVDNSRDLMDNLLFWAKNQINKQEITIREIRVHPIIDQTFYFMEKQAGAKNITLVNEGVESHGALADPDMIKIILRNLVANAIKFTADGGTIKVRTKYNADKTLAMEIEDNGVGISPEKQEMLLGNKHFTSAGTAQEKGSGLGLMICRDLTKKNNGLLSFTSEAGKGTIFTLTLPSAIIQPLSGRQATIRNLVFYNDNTLGKRWLVN